jgi:hypothetical protein
MTKYHFEVYDDQGSLIHIGCWGAMNFEFAGFIVKRFWDGVEI